MIRSTASVSLSWAGAHKSFLRLLCEMAVTEWIRERSDGPAIADGDAGPCMLNEDFAFFKRNFSNGEILLDRVENEVVEL